MYILEIRNWYDETPILHHITDPAKLSCWWYGRHFSVTIFEYSKNIPPSKICRKRKYKKIKVWNLKAPSLITILICLKYSTFLNNHYYNKTGSIIHRTYILDDKIGELITDVLSLGLRVKGRKYWKWSGSPKYRLGQDLNLEQMIFLLSNLGNKKYIIKFLKKRRKKLFLDILTKR